MAKMGKYLTEMLLGHATEGPYTYDAQQPNQRSEEQDFASEQRSQWITAWEMDL